MPAEDTQSLYMYLICYDLNLLMRNKELNFKNCVKMKMFLMKNQLYFVLCLSAHFFIHDIINILLLLQC